jgi:C_GCAxxG_C_C family probable redox protein
MDKINQAVSCFASGFNCSQAIVSTYAPELGIDRALALKLASGFGGGIARTGETCGAVSGAIIVIGLKHGDSLPGDKAPREKTYRLIRELTDQFKARNKSIKCKEILHCDISDAADHARAADQKLFTTICPKMVADAAELLEDVLQK